MPLSDLYKAMEQRHGHGRIIDYPKIDVEKRRVGGVAANSRIRNDGQGSPAGRRDCQPTGPTSMSFYRLIGVVRSLENYIQNNSSFRFKIQSLFLAMDGATLFLGWLTTGSGVQLNE